MPKVYIGLGSNIEDKYSNITQAVALLAERVGDVLALSSVYETKPWGFTSQNTFLNAVLLLDTDFTPEELLKETRQIELGMGRIEKSEDGVYHDRSIDIDLLLFDDRVMQTPILTLPHPLMHKRKFVLEPLTEIAPALIHPVLKKSMRELLDEISHTS
ncbi:2-amino-4-hydroxy-6-hydroxymethyldihydropteridine diphosphokinase [Parabacteroides sp. OttesenSCG-928-G07]|nr:2-amino-4-hydroxy-6-hydroxymethyldihydropteridine diphosphokinase [Parabacteroides sp. OttesenSCG-928-G21]MDL2278091.1 2-amino-4-hydroxy-6-hydroxymethyldihydropteridine diphosphokinase [Parabacteroides sp. OttesenSCG-928-G07]